MGKEYTREICKRLNTFEDQQLPILKVVDLYYFREGDNVAVGEETNA